LLTLAVVWWAHFYNITSNDVEAVEHADHLSNLARCTARQIEEGTVSEVDVCTPKVTLTALR
jgi:hypothetical protein